MSEKTEKATPRREREARNEGNVARSEEVGSYVQLAIVFSYFLYRGNGLIEAFSALVTNSIIATQHPSRAALNMIIEASAMLVADMIGPLLILLVLGSVLGNFVQTGPLLATEALKLNWSAINPAENLKKIFSKDKLVTLGKTLALLTVVSLLIFTSIWTNLSSVVLLSVCGAHCAAVFLELVSRHIFQSLIAFGVILCLVDFLYQKYKHAEDMKMSREDVKREHKDDEGDPEIKRKRREIYEELKGGNFTETVKRSNAVVRNPTHIAVCIYYQPGETLVPRVTLKGADRRAARIVEIAMQEGVPVVENIPLAHALRKVPEGRYIPGELFVAVAELFALLDRMKSSPPESDQDVS